MYLLIDDVELLVEAVVVVLVGNDCSAVSTLVHDVCVGVGGGSGDGFRPNDDDDDDDDEDELANDCCCC